MICLQHLLPFKDCSPKKTRYRLALILFLAGCSACIAVAMVFHYMRSARTHSLQPSTRVAAAETVSVVHPTKLGAVTLEVPGYTDAFTEAPIYAQTSGYLTKWYFDIGAKVKANDGRHSRSNLPVAPNGTSNPK